MDELTALKEEYKNIINDIKEHPDHSNIYDLERMNNELYLKRVQNITGCNVIEIAQLESLPNKVLNQIGIFIKGIIHYRF